VLIQTGRAPGPIEFWRALLEREGVPVARLLEGPQDTTPLRVESSGGKRRYTGGAVRDPKAFAQAWRAAGLMR